MSTVYYQCLLLGQLFQIMLYQAILHPVLAYLSCFAIGYQLVRIERYIKTEVVVYHHLKSFAFYTITFVFIYWFRMYITLGTIAITIYFAACTQLFQKLWSKLCMQIFGNVSQGVFQRNICLLRRQPETTVGCTSHSFCKFRICRQFVWYRFFHIIITFSVSK